MKLCDLHLRLVSVWHLPFGHWDIELIEKVQPDGVFDRSVLAGPGSFHLGRPPACPWADSNRAGIISQARAIVTPGYPELSHAVFFMTYRQIGTDFYFVKMVVPMAAAAAAGPCTLKALPRQCTTNDKWNTQMKNCNACEWRRSSESKFRKAWRSLRCRPGVTVAGEKVGHLALCWLPRDCAYSRPVSVSVAPPLPPPNDTLFTIYHWFDGLHSYFHFGI